MNTSVAKKAGQAVRLLMMVLTAVLIFFINVMLLVSDIQARRVWSTTPAWYAAPRSAS